MKKILVTGGAGFIGSHLCETLVQNSNNCVYSLDNYFSGSEDNHIGGVSYIRGSTKEINSLIDFTPDFIYHLGEYSRVEQSFQDMEKILEYNKEGTFAVLEFVRKHKCKFLYAGSSTKYGDLGANSSPYAWSKASNTDLVKNYGDWYGIDYRITYFYNVYGSREISTGKYATLIALFDKLMREGKDLTVVSPGTQERNFTHIDDIIDGLILVAENGYGDEYGIGSHECYSVLEIAKMFGGKVVMFPARKGNRMGSPVISEKTRQLGWTPQWSIRDYIQSLKIKNGY